MPGCAKLPVMPTGDWPENRLNVLASARTAMSSASLRKLNPPRPVMTFFDVSIRIGSAAATPPRTVKAIRPQLIWTGSFSSFSNIFWTKVPMSSSASCAFLVHSEPAGRMNAIRPFALASESWMVSPRPVSWTRPLTVPVVPASATPQPASNRPSGVGDRRMS